ncbi:glycosyltransferase family 2 protein, partial [Phocaeicola sp. Sa1YUN3]|nr:glycosyltransferase family 2 protein [Phocaeicola faecium]
MSVPEISIVVPVYRTDPKLFEQCLDSLTRQGLSAGEWELIIVFDGPQDAALFDVCERFGHEHGNNVTQIMSDTRGVSAARNAGMDRASGKWLAFLDSDDSLPDSALSLMMRYADDHTCDIVMGDHTSVLG